MSQLFTILGEERPRMDIPAARKDEDYHRRMGRSDLGALNTRMITRMCDKAWRIERAFNDQILTQEDIDTFMLDDSMNTRNRTMFNFNLVRSIIEQYRGTAVQSTFNASVVPVTHHSQTRRQMELGKRMLMHSLAEMSKESATIIGSQYDLGGTMQETQGIFESMWQDRNITAMNHLLERMAALNDMERFNSDDMLRFVIWGVLPEIARAEGHFKWQRIHPSEFFFDPTFREPDMSDASFMGVFPQMSMPRIAELWNVDPEAVKDIESSIKQYGPNRYGDFSLMGRTKVRVTSNYWTDVMYQEFGYMLLNDIPTLVRVGDREDGLKDNPISYNDLIDPPGTEADADLFHGKKTRKSFVECTRFVDMLTWEDMAGTSIHENKRKDHALGRMPDLVLDHGVYGLQEYDPFDPVRARFPIKVTTYAVAGGEIISPIQAIMEPNRFINRILSAIEAQANMSGGKALGVDMDMVDPALTEEDVALRAKQGRVIPFHANGRGVGNSMQSHDDSMGSGAYAMLQIVNAVQDLIRTVSGVNASFAGEAQKNQLVGVTDVLIQRGALMMEPVHDAFADLKLQKYRCMATAGKEFYLQRPALLVEMVSEADLVPLIQGRWFAMERFNAMVRRDNPEQAKRKTANAWLDILIQQGLIDRTRYADLYNRSYVDEVAAGVRQYAAELGRAEAVQQREQAKQQIIAGLTQQYQQADAQEQEAYKDQVNMAQMLAKEGAKEKARITRAEVDADIEKEQLVPPSA